MTTRNDESTLPQLSYRQLVELGVPTRWADLVNVLGFDCFVLVWRNLQYTQEICQFNIPDYRQFHSHLVQAYRAELEYCTFSEIEKHKHIKSVFGD